MFVVCWTGPGINLAQSSVWLACAMALAVFDIGKYVDGFGNVVEPKIYYSDGTIRSVLLNVPNSGSPPLVLFFSSLLSPLLDLVPLCAYFCLCYWLTTSSATLLCSNTPSSHVQRRAQSSSLRLSCEVMTCSSVLSIFSSTCYLFLNFRKPLLKYLRWRIRSHLACGRSRRSPR